MSAEVAPRFAGPWPFVTDLVRGELAGFLGATADEEVRTLPTRCEPWTVRDVAAHLAQTLQRCCECLERSRAGDFSPPFALDELSAENLKAVEEFSGDPFKETRARCERFLSLVSDPAEPMAHPFGAIPTGLQMRFVLNELAIHRDDVDVARGVRYRPSDRVVEALLPVWEDVLGLADPDETDPWSRIVVGSGR